MRILSSLEKDDAAALKICMRLKRRDLRFDNP
jgi:hypothetical protein